MLINVPMRLRPLRSHKLFSHPSTSRAASLAALAAALTIPLLSGCNRAAAGTPVATANAREVESARQQLELIPPPSKTRFMAVHSLASWENPSLTVQQNLV